ncbi:hypothetical protein [Luteimonas salinilitoris]|uniref:hypothetical protein n=1 Tax=Luteimonas salinilitoris TaxID=3237697 RepID=UPI00351C6D93
MLAMAAMLAAGLAWAQAAGYAWRNVAIGGGGFVTGLVFHPSEPGLLYARTDSGGAYRWLPGARRWLPLLDWMGHDDHHCRMAWRRCGVSWRRASRISFPPAGRN